MGSLNITHTLVVFKFCFNKDNHKQTIHNVKFNINNTNSVIVINCINFFFMLTYVFYVFMLTCFLFDLVKFSLHEKALP